MKFLSVLMLPLFLFSCEYTTRSIADDYNDNAVNTFNNTSSDCNFKSYITGNKEDKVTNPESGLILMGGGKDVNEAFSIMSKNSDKGDFVVLRSSGEDGYNPYIYSEIGGVDSVETILIDSKEKALCPEVAKKIREAEALFIAGGDQSTYYTYWKNTPVQDALNYLVNNKKITIGGTSAGLAVLGNIVYTAEKASLNSIDVLNNPLNEKVTLKNDFLNIDILKDSITDTHFDQRNRQGRLIGFMANAVNYNFSDPSMIKGIGVDENTAIYINNSGIGTVLGSRYAWLFRSVSKPENYSPFNWSKIRTLKIKGTPSGNNAFDFNKWKLIKGNSELINYEIKNANLLINN